MRTTTQWLCVVLATTLGCVSGMKPEEVQLFVMKEGTNEAGTCYQACDVIPPAELKLPMCSAATSQCEVTAGWERLRVVVYYGAFALEEKVPLPTTAIELIVDGAPQARRHDAVLGAGERTRETERMAIADFVVPAVSGQALEVRAVTDGAWTQSPVRIPLRLPGIVLRATPSCEAPPCSLARSTGRVGFTIEAPASFASRTAQLSFRQDGILTGTASVALTSSDGRAVGSHSEAVPAAGARWEALASVEGYVSPPVSFELTRPTVSLVIVGCGGPSTCTAVRGTGELEYAVTAPEDFTPPSVTLEGRTDANAFTPLASRPFELRDRLRVARGTLPVPETGERWQLVGVVAGVSTPVLDVSLTAPAFQVQAPRCPDSGACVLEEGVGDLDLTVSAPRAFRATEVSALERLDGVARTGGTAKFSKLADASVASVRLPVPEGGQAWSVRLESGGQLVGEQVVTLIPPSIDVRVQQCGEAPCSRVAGSPVTLEVSAPAGLRSTTLSVEYRRNGVSTGVLETVKLDTLDGTRRTGRMTTVLPADAAGQVWQASVRAGRFAYPAPPIQVTAVP
jgi:hypothetical protein